eukprot:3791255-Prymnesium_polylepis.1
MEDSGVFIWARVWGVFGSLRNFVVLQERPALCRDDRGDGRARRWCAWQRSRRSGASKRQSRSSRSRRLSRRTEGADKSASGAA